MLPPFIIEQIRKREDEERRRHEAERPRLELPLHDRLPVAPPDDEEADDRADEPGVVILDLG